MQPGASPLWRAGATAALSVVALGGLGLAFHWPLAFPIVGVIRFFLALGGLLASAVPILVAGTLLHRAITGGNRTGPVGFKVAAIWVAGQAAVTFLLTALLVLGALVKGVLLLAAAAGWAVAAVWAIRERGWLRAWLAWLRRWATAPDGHTYTTLLVVLLGAALIAATAPPDSRDELVYHLTVPSMWLLQHNWSLPTGNVHWLLTGNAEALWTWGLATGGLLVPRLLTWLTGVVALALAWSIARPHGRSVAAASTLFLAAAPITLVSLATCNVEWPLIAALLLGAAAIERHLRGGDRGDARLAALALGLAAGSKLTALPAVAILVGRWVVILAGRRQLRVALRAAAVAALCVAVLAGGWWVRNWRLTGDPVYPFGSMVGLVQPAPVHVSELVDYSRVPWPWRLVPWLWHATVEPAVDHRLHPGWAVLMIGVLAAGWRTAGMPWLAVAGAALPLLAHSPAPRAWLPAMALAWLWLPGWLARLMAERRARLVTHAALALCVVTSLPPAWLGTVGSSPAWERYLFGVVDARTALRQAGVTSAVIDHVRDHTAVESRIWTLGEERTLYLERWARSDSYLDPPSLLVELARLGPEGLARELRLQRIDYVLVDLDRCPLPVREVRSEAGSWPVAPSLAAAVDRFFALHLVEETRDPSRVLFRVRATRAVR